VRQGVEPHGAENDVKIDGDPLRMIGIRPGSSRRERGTEYPYREIRQPTTRPQDHLDTRIDRYNAAHCRNRSGHEQCVAAEHGTHHSDL